MPDITDDSEFRYIVETEVENFSNIQEGLVTKELPPSKYALFTHKGSITGVKDTYDFIYGTWLAGTDYELAELDTIELYDERSNDLLSPNYEFDIYIPLK